MSPRSRSRRSPKRKGPARAPRADSDGRPPGRYTAPAPVFRTRPRWHKALGIATALLGIGLIVVNYMDYVGSELLPGGHQDGYLLLGVLIVVSSVWWFGLFDRPE